MANPNKLGSPAPSHSPSRASIILVVVSVGLLALMVWWLNPRAPQFKPAPLEPLSVVCPNPSRPFVPSNMTDIPAPIMSKLPAPVRTHVIRRMNFEACPCGCKLSVASCLLDNPNCEAATRKFKDIVEQEEKAARQAEARP